MHSMIKTRIYRGGWGNTWHLLDAWGYSLCTSDTPAGIRRKKRGYYLYMTQPDSEMDRIIQEYFINVE